MRFKYNIFRNVFRTDRYCAIDLDRPDTGLENDSRRVMVMLARTLSDSIKALYGNFDVAQNHYGNITYGALLIYLNNGFDEISNDLPYIEQDGKKYSTNDVIKLSVLYYNYVKTRLKKIGKDVDLPLDCPKEVGKKINAIIRLGLHCGSDRVENVAGWSFEQKAGFVAAFCNELSEIAMLAEADELPPNVPSELAKFAEFTERYAEVIYALNAEKLIDLYKETGFAMRYVSDILSERNALNIMDVMDSAEKECLAVAQQQLSRDIENVLKNGISNTSFDIEDGCEYAYRTCERFVTSAHQIIQAIDSGSPNKAGHDVTLRRGDHHFVINVVTRDTIYDEQPIVHLLSSGYTLLNYTRDKNGIAVMSFCDPRGYVSDVAIYNAAEFGRISFGSLYCR